MYEVLLQILTATSGTVKLVYLGDPWSIRFSLGFAFLLGKIERSRDHRGRLVLLHHS